MLVSYRTRAMEKDCADDRNRKRAFGTGRAKRLTVRLSQLLAAEDLEDLRHAPGHFHPLRGDLAGEFAADLDGPFRLIFEPVLADEAGNVPSNGNDWSAITHVRILRIEDYHG